MGRYAIAVESNWWVSDGHSGRRDEWTSGKRGGATLWVRYCTCGTEGFRGMYISSPLFILISPSLNVFVLPSTRITADTHIST